MSDIVLFFIQTEMSEQPETTPKPFMDELREWRGRRRQKEVAVILNVPCGTVRSWEWGKRTPKKLTLEAVRAKMKEHPEANVA